MINTIQKLWIGLLLSLLPLTHLMAQDAVEQTDKPDQEVRKASNLEELLRLIEQRRLHWSDVNSGRERTFTARKNEQQRLLREARDERDRLERISEQLEEEYQANEVVLGELQDKLNERLGTLRELFGVLQQVAGDTRGVIESSIISAQYPNRSEWLDSFARRMGVSTELATIQEMEQLWILIQQEMTATGQVVRFRGTVTESNGAQKETDIVRVGAFNLFTDKGYLDYQGDAESIIALPRQPSARFTNTTDNLYGADTGELVRFAVDPTRGSLLGLLIQSKTITERIQDGGSVGAVIIVLGIIGVLLAIFQYLYLSGVRRKVRSQMKQDTPQADNPLGRVLSVGVAHQNVDVEALELKLSEAILAETPKLIRFLPIVQVISVVSPLLGLLGTVIGMILTFQAITLFGTGDPQTMAGGISTALMTTVLGLCAAIPTVLLHAIVSSKSRELMHILEEQVTGMVALQAEKSGRSLN